MSDPALALNRALIEALRGAATVTALVPAARISTRDRDVTDFPVIHVGEGQTVDPGASIRRDLLEVYADVHAFDRAADGNSVTFERLKRITSAVRGALPVRTSAEGWDLFDLHVASIRHVHDPDGVSVHAVVSVAALAAEAA